MHVVVLVSGGGTNLQAILDRLASGVLRNVRIVRVISSSYDAYALRRAADAHIPTSVIARKDFTDTDAYDRGMLSELQKDEADLIVLAGFLSLLGPLTVHAFSGRILNIHPSLIPAFCGHGMYGIRPHEAAIKRGVKISGATVHFVTEGYDEGPILLQKAIGVEPDDTPQSLQQRIMRECEQEILPEAIQLIADKRVCLDHNRVIILPNSAKTSEGES